LAIGTHGTLKQRNDREMLITGLQSVIKRIEPKVIVVYGCAPANIFDQFRQQGIEIFQFDSEFAAS